MSDLSLFSPPVTGPRFDVMHDGASYRAMTLDDLRAAGVPDEIVLATLKGHFKAAVDAKAEALRSSITTPGTGQAMEYQEVQTQAFAALKAPSSATAAKYPMLAASVGIDIDPDTGAPATDILGVARSIMAAYQLWLAAGAAIRGVRLSAKKAIDEVTSIEAASEMMDAIAWPDLSAAAAPGGPA